MKSTWNVHGKCEKFAFGTQRNLYSTDLHLGFDVGVTQILGLALGITQIFAFLDITCCYPKRKILAFGVLTNTTPQRENVASQWNIGLEMPMSHVIPAIYPCTRV